MMPSEIEQLKQFVNLLRSDETLISSEVTHALEALGGMDGIKAENLIVSGYECLGWLTGRKLSFEQLHRFCEANGAQLSEHPSKRYFFIQALIEAADLDTRDLKQLAKVLPTMYIEFLSKRFPEMKEEKPNELDEHD